MIRAQIVCPWFVRAARCRKRLGIRAWNNALMHLRTPGTLDQSIDALKMVVNNANAVLDGWPATLRQNRLETAKDAYLRWVDDATMSINNYLSEEGLTGNLRAHAYWHIYDLSANDPRPYPLVEHEIRLQQRLLNAVIARLETLRAFVNRPGSIVVPDTSAFLQGRDFKEFDWSGALDIRPLPIRLVVPVLVIEELEKVKTFERGDGRHVARRVLKDLRSILGTAPPGGSAGLRTNVTIEALVDDDRHVRLDNHDGEIIDQAIEIQEITGRPVTLVSLDLPMDLRARLRNVRVATIPEKAVPAVP